MNSTTPSLRSSTPVAPVATVTTVNAEVAKLQYVFDWVRDSQSCIVIDEGHKPGPQTGSWYRAVALHEKLGRQVIRIERWQSLGHFRNMQYYHITMANVIVEAANPIQFLSFDGFPLPCSHPARRLRVNFDFACRESGWCVIGSSEPLKIQYDYWRINSATNPTTYHYRFATQALYHSTDEWRKLEQVHTDPMTDLLPWLTEMHVLMTLRRQPVDRPDHATTGFVNHRLFDAHLVRLIAQFVNPPSIYASIRHCFVGHLPACEAKPWICNVCRTRFPGSS